jgi:hypothetical protein
MGGNDPLVGLVEMVLQLLFDGLILLPDKKTERVQLLRGK